MKSLLKISKVFDYFRTITGGERLNDIILSEYLPNLDELHLLDLGCGTGAILNHLPQSVHYRGVDISAEYVNAAQGRNRKMAEFVCADIEQYETEDRFDIILCIGVLHHLTDDRAIDLIGKAQRFLKAGGTLLTCDGVFIDGQSWIARTILKNDRGAFVRTKENYLKLWERAGIMNPEINIRHELLKIPFSHIIIKYCKAT